jgi:hypothetical protein
MEKLTSRILENTKGTDKEQFGKLFADIVNNKELLKAVKDGNGKSGILPGEMNDLRAHLNHTLFVLASISLTDVDKDKETGRVTNIREHLTDEDIETLRIF